MNIKTRIISTCLLALAATATIGNPALACAFGEEAFFTYTNHPDFPLKQYAAGKLGVLQPMYARSYLLAAYRFLANQPLSADEQQAMVSLWDERLTSSQYGCATDPAVWLKARATVAGAPKLESIDSEKPVNPDEPWQTFCNCQGAAFVKATETLNGLISKFGASSNEVKDWLSAQDKVFTNCGQGYDSSKKVAPAIPAALPGGANELLQKHRAYQIACANFYAQNYPAAVKEFDAIGTDNASPWKDLSAYLAVRSLIRQGSLAKTPDKTAYAEAQKRLKAMLANPEFNKMRDDLLPLQDYVAARVSPEQHLQDLVKSGVNSKGAGEFTKTIDMLLKVDDTDVSALTYASLPTSVKQNELVDWIMTFQSKDQPAVAHAVDRWKQTHSVPWLVAAARVMSGNDPNASTVIEAAQKEQNAAAKWTLFYHANRLNVEQGKLDVARAALDKVLGAPPADMGISSINALKTQRLPLARNVDEFLKFGVQTPAAVGVTGGIDQVPDDVADREQGKNPKTAPLFTPEAGYVLRNKLPLRVLKAIAENKELPMVLKNNVAWTSWVRAILVEDEVMAKSLAVVMKPYNKNREKLVDAYLAATTPEDRKFAAAYMISQFSSGQPNPLSEIEEADGYGDESGWWWGEKPVMSSVSDGVKKIDPIFLSAADKAQATQELAKLAKVKTAPNYLSTIIINYAKAHPTDPRVPQALHFAVKTTRYGATDDASKVLSKQAFTILHNQYKNNPWTKKTPYYF